MFSGGSGAPCSMCRVQGSLPCVAAVVGLGEAVTIHVEIGLGSLSITNKRQLFFLGPAWRKRKLE